MYWYSVANNQIYEDIKNVGFDDCVGTFEIVPSNLGEIAMIGLMKLQRGEFNETNLKDNLKDYIEFKYNLHINKQQLRDIVEAVLEFHHRHTANKYAYQAFDDLTSIKITSDHYTVNYSASF